PIDERIHLLAKIDRGNQQLSILGLARASGQVIKELTCVGANLIVRGKQTDVCVGAGSSWIVVSRSDVHISLERITFTTDHQCQFAVSFQTEQSVHYVDARFIQLSRPLDI